MSLVFRPKIFSDYEFRKFRRASGVEVVDIFDRQLRELFFIDNNLFIGREKREVYETAEFKKYAKTKSSDFNYVYYPWLNRVIKLVKEADFFKLKTNRNQDLITSQEQVKLYNYKVAVLGMSVGSNIAYILTQAGISKKIVVADFDELDTTNLNRIQARVTDVGLNKAIIAARRIYEENPYIGVSCLTRGIDGKTLRTLLKKKSVDCIVEEIDNMDMKVTVRKIACEHGIPVLMITDNGDRVVLTVERYDLGYNKIFDKDFGYFERKLKVFSGHKDFADIVINDIVGGVEKVDPRMMSSVDLVFEKKLVSWPQLGSAAILGGVVVTVALKKIVRGEHKKHFTRDYVSVLE